MIGIDYYPSLGQGEREAPGAADNARRVYDALFEQNGLAAFGMLLTNRNAEKADIQDAIEEAVEKALLDPVTRTSDDYLVIYFSGKSGQDYLVPYDSAGSGWADEITDYDLERWLRQFPGSVTVIIDGTESATMADGHILRPLAWQNVNILCLALRVGMNKSFTIKICAVVYLPTISWKVLVDGTPPPIQIGTGGIYPRGNFIITSIVK